jgi:hypothetical protein
MILFITSTALLYWAVWLYWQHVIIPIDNEQITNCNDDAKASKNLGDCPAVCQTTVMVECPECNGTGIIELN